MAWRAGGSGGNLAAVKPTPQTHRGLICLKAATPFDPTSGALPDKLLFLKWGDNVTTQGTVRVGEKTLQCLAANQKQAGFEEVSIDFEHNSVPTSPTYRGEPVTVAATHCQPSVVRGEGLYLLSCNWTPEGITNARSYPDLSPAILTDESGEVTFIHSGSICRNGSTEGLRFFSANPLQSSMINLDDLRKLLQLSADASVEDINSAIASASAETTQPGALTTLAAKFDKALTTLGARLDAAEAANTDRERAGIVEAALNEGKQIPEAWLPKDGKGGLPVDQLRTLCATLPITVPLDQRTPENLKTLAAGVPAQNSVDETVRNLLGLSKEAWDKTK